MRSGKSHLLGCQEDQGLRLSVCSYDRSDVCRRLACNLGYRKLLVPPSLPGGGEDMRTPESLLSTLPGTW